MLNVIKLLWGTTAGKVSFALILGLFIAGIGLAYSAGSTSGHETGFTAGKNSRNEEVAQLEARVTTLVGLVNAKRDAEAKKIDKVEIQASDAAVTTQKELAKQVRERDSIIARYQAQTPIVVKEACGLSIETVRAINLLIDNANNETTLPPLVSDGSAPPGPDLFPVPQLAAHTLQEGAAP